VRIICFGDSNTWGYDPRSYFGERYERCWVDILAKMSGWKLVNRGLNGRTIPEGEVLIPDDTRLLMVMLGTNDLLQGCSAEEAAERMHDFLSSLPNDKLLLIAPVPLVRGEWVGDDELISESKRLAEACRGVAEELGIAFTNTADWGIPLCFDGVHFTEEGHRIFAEKLYHDIKEKELC